MTSYVVKRPSTIHSKFLRELPNRLTFFRIAAVPALLFIYPFDYGYTNYICAGLFFFAAITDFFDGYLARKYESITKLGSLLDPIADKMLSGACLILLAYSQTVSPWMAGLILCRDIAVSGLRLVALEQGYSIHVSKLGKWKTFFQDIGIFGLLLNQDVWGLPWIVTGKIAMWATLMVSFYSGYEYFKSFFLNSKKSAKCEAISATKN